MSESSLPVVSSSSEYFRPLPAYTVPHPRPRYWLHLLLLLLTFCTTLITGARMQYNFAHNQPALSLSDDSVPYVPASWILSHPERVLNGLPFAAAVMFFFLAHEMGHYLCCRHYGIYATLPFFIPMPTMIGTMGAVIIIRSPIRSRTALFDIGISGPIAGFIVALGLLLASLPFSKPVPVAVHASVPDIELGYPLIFRWVHQLFAAIHPTSAAIPLNQTLLHPVAIAAWVGMFATALNLLPGGQLDGGHILYSIFPRAHKVISRLAILALLPMAYYFWVGWIVWAILLQVSSLRHPQVAEFPRVSGTRSWLAAFAVFMLVCTLNYAPLGVHPIPEITRELAPSVRDWFSSLSHLLHR
jgi:hypothetical protein